MSLCTPFTGMPTHLHSDPPKGAQKGAFRIFSYAGSIPGLFLSQNSWRTPLSLSTPPVPLLHYCAMRCVIQMRASCICTREMVVC